jgi:hypothetical protein
VPLFEDLKIEGLFFNLPPFPLLIILADGTIFRGKRREKEGIVDLREGGGKKLSAGRGYVE